VGTPGFSGIVHPEDWHPCHTLSRRFVHSFASPSDCQLLRGRFWLISASPGPWVVPDTQETLAESCLFPQVPCTDSESLPYHHALPSNFIFFSAHRLLRALYLRNNVDPNFWAYILTSHYIIPLCPSYQIYGRLFLTVIYTLTQQLGICPLVQWKFPSGAKSMTVSAKFHGWISQLCWASLRTISLRSCSFSFHCTELS
jgi:hypothetical protein